MTDVIRAPWSEEQVRNLNAWQTRGNVHPYTCTGDHGSQRDRVLLAREEGWICRECGYTQDWAWEFSARNFKISGGYTDPEVEALARHSRKFGYYGSIDHVWHLIDTVRSRRVRIADLRGLAGERGAKLVRLDDQLRDVRRRLRTLLLEVDGVLACDIPSTRERLQAAADDLRAFAWPNGLPDQDDQDEDDEDEHE